MHASLATSSYGNSGSFRLYSAPSCGFPRRYSLKELEFGWSFALVIHETILHENDTSYDGPVRSMRYSNASS